MWHKNNVKTELDSMDLLKSFCEAPAHWLTFYDKPPGFSQVGLICRNTPKVTTGTDTHCSGYGLVEKYIYLFQTIKVTAVWHILRCPLEQNSWF